MRDLSKKIEEYLNNPNKCKYCGKPILPKEGQRLADVKAKKFCNLSCSAYYNSNKQAQENKEKALNDYLADPNICQCCGEPILPKKGQRLSDVKVKKFCNQSCAAIYNNKDDKRIKHGKYKKDRTCINCGEILNKGATKYCCHNCQQDYKYKQYISNWKEGKESGSVADRYVSDYIRKYLFDKYDNSCCKCGWNKINEVSNKCPLQIHHIDGDYKNNSEENLELLCPNCHSLTHNYGALNRGNGRDYRYKNKKS